VGTSAILELGVGAAVALLMIERVYVLVKMILDHSKKNPVDETIKVMGEQLHDLYSWHDINDDEGVKIWYNRRSVERAVEKIADSQATQTEILKNLTRLAETQTELTKEIHKNSANLFMNLTQYRETTCPFRGSLEKLKNGESK